MVGIICVMTNVMLRALFEVSDTIAIVGIGVRHYLEVLVPSEQGGK